MSEADTGEDVVEGPARSKSKNKGRSNAILTYHLLSEFDGKLTTLVVEFSHFRKSQQQNVANHQDHEARLRLLETRMTAFESVDKGKTSSSASHWYGIVAGATILIQIGSFLVSLYSKTH